MQASVTQNKDPSPLDLVVVGAGVSGLYMIHRARQQGWQVQAFESGSGVGGTWYWNRYPGCRVDIESFEYSYSFSEELQQEWEWSERYAPQAELERYLNHVADRFGLRDHIRFNTRVEAAHFDERANCWRVRTADGQTVQARFIVMATGIYSDPYLPAFEGLESFEGVKLQSSRWPREPVDVTGKRVGIIGTGASGVQLTPILAQQAAQLTVFQRTASYTVPLQNRKADPALTRTVKDNYAALREAQRVSSAGFTTVHSRPVPPPTLSALEVDEQERRRVYEDRWASGGLCFYHAFTDLLIDERANQTLEIFMKERIRARVRKPEVAEKLTPRMNPVMTKRLAGDTNYCETFDRDNVELVDLRAEPIEGFTRQGLRVGEREIALDVIVFATGFDLGTGAMSRIDIRGREGRALNTHWEQGVRSYLGLMSHGFPNLFWLFGPGCPFYNPVLLAQYQGDLVAKLIDDASRLERRTVEATREAEVQWSALSNQIAEATLFTRGQNYYMGDNIPGKPRVATVFLGGFPMYAEHCERAAREHEGLMLGA